MHRLIHGDGSGRGGGWGIGRRGEGDVGGIKINKSTLFSEGDT